MFVYHISVWHFDSYILYNQTYTQPEPGADPEGDAPGAPLLKLEKNMIF
jgi:hypothetical protein